MSETASPNPVESPPLASTQIHSKVGAGAAAGALAILTVWGLQSAGIAVPDAPAIAIGTVYAFIAGYSAKS